MAIRPILLHPDPRLRKACEPVPRITAEVGRLAEDMLATMYDAPGIGLAAPQVGVLKRVIVLDVAPEGEPPAPRAAFDGFIAHLFEALDARGYFHPPERREAMETKIRAAFARAGLTEAETRTLRGAVKSLSLPPRKEKAR